MTPAQDPPPTKARNKLRKPSKHRPEPLTTGPTLSSVPSSHHGRTSTDSSRRNSSDGHHRGRQMPSSPLPCVTASAPPPDLSSPKWHEYVNRKSGLLCPMETSPHLRHTRSRSPAITVTTPTSAKSVSSSSSSPRLPPDVVPELAHLAVNDSPRSSFQTGRSSSELSTPSSSSSTTDPPRSPASSSSTMRRYAKTPVLRIGQLEGEPTPPPVPSPRRLEMDKPESVDRIAEQYIALLSARGDDNLHHENYDGENEEDESQWQMRQQSVDMIRSATTRRASPPPPLQRQLTPPQPTIMETPATPEADGLSPGASPTSDGTLVDFEEDAIYFKPAFSPEALSPILEAEFDDELELRSPPPLATPERNSLSLQICMDLLQRELSATMKRNRPRNGAVAAATANEEVQVWMMIEAYERLKDRVVEMRLAVEERRALEAMFESWLGALYRMHGEFSGGVNGGARGARESQDFHTVDLE